MLHYSHNVYSATNSERFSYKYIHDDLISSNADMQIQAPNSPLNTGVHTKHDASNAGFPRQDFVWHYPHFWSIPWHFSCSC